MATTTDPTVPLPTATDNDDDDDDDDGVPIAPAPPQPPTPAPPQPPTPAPNVPTTSVSASASASSLSTLTSVASPTSTDASASSSPTAASGSGGLSSGASAGIGVGAAIAIILLLLAGCFFVRRRRSRLRRLSEASAASDAAHDFEKAGVGMGPDIREHRAVGPAEMEAGNSSGRRPSELASPVVPVEAAGDRSFAVELPGSEVPPAGVRKGSRERLFLDSPIDEEEGRFEKDLRPPL